MDRAQALGPSAGHVPQHRGLDSTDTGLAPRLPVLVPVRRCVGRKPRDPSRHCTLTHTQILETIRGSASDDPQRSLRTHMANLRRKIERDPMHPRLIVTEPGVGYRWVGDLWYGDTA